MRRFFLLLSVLIALLIPAESFAGPFMVLHKRGSAWSGEAWKPTDVSGCVLWLDASQLTGLSDGDPVASWSDESGQSHDAAQSTADKKPEYDIAPTVIFSNDYLTITDTADLEFGTGDFAIFALAKFTGGDAGNSVIIAHNNITTGTYPYWSFRKLGNLFAYYSDDNYTQHDTNANSGEKTINAAAYYVVSVYRSGTEIKVGVDGSYGAAGATNTPAGDIDGVINVGYDDMWGTGCAMELKELIVYKGTVSSDDRAKIESYLADKK